MKTILISDSLRQFVPGENILNRGNIQILTAPSSQEILSIHRNVKPYLIIIDLNMPDMPGGQLCPLLRKESAPDTVKILIAADSKEAGIKQCEQCSADGYITKPINAALLLEKIAELLDIPMRKAYRMQVKATVAGEIGRIKFAASTINISATGMLIESGQRLNLRDTINCSFILPGTLAIAVTGEIVRILKKPAGSIHQYGINFTSISGAAQRIIEDFVKSQAEPAE